MDFDSPGAAQSRKQPQYNRTSSSPAAFANDKAGARPNETRAEKLKREYAQKQQNSNRVWDEVDQRWVDTHPDEHLKTSSAPPRAGSATNGNKKAVGISLDPSNAVGKSASVQAAVNQRVN